MALASATRHELDGSVIILLVQEFVQISVAHGAQIDRHGTAAGKNERSGQKTLLRIDCAVGIQALFHQIHHQIAQGPTLQGRTGLEVLE